MLTFGIMNTIEMKQFFGEDFKPDERGNFIHPTAIIGDYVKLGANNYVGAYCVIEGATIIGDGNRFEAFVSVGAPPEHRDFLNGCENAGVSIGSGNVFREFVTINSGMRLMTTIGNGVTMLKGSHVGHDSRIDDNVTMSCNVIIGGHSVVMTGANIGLSSVCHQYSVIGGYSMVGMGTVITKKSEILPECTYVGNPARKIGENARGQELAKQKNISTDMLERLYIKERECRNTK